eukprot:9689774-Alexandrium_andersonii.AAC.1
MCIRDRSSTSLVGDARLGPLASDSCAGPGTGSSRRWHAASCAREHGSHRLHGQVPWQLRSGPGNSEVAHAA